MARRYAEADDLRRKFGGCNTMPGLAKDWTPSMGPKYIKPSTVQAHALDAQRQGR
jgi:hypothetical protein